MAGQHDGFLHFKKLFGFYGGEGVFLGIHRAVLQGQIHLGKSDGRGVGAAGLPSGGIGRCIGHANLQAFDVRTLAKGFLSSGVSCAVVGVSRDLDTAFVAKLIHHLLEQGAFGISQQVVTIAKDKGVVGDAKARVATRSKRGAADDDIHRTQGEALV